MSSHPAILLPPVPAGDRHPAGEAPHLCQEAGGMRVSAEGAGRALPQGDDGVPGAAGGLGGATAPAAGRQGPADERDHQQVGTPLLGPSQRAVLSQV